MEDRNILSREEVDAIIKSTNNMGDGTEVENAESANAESINTNALENIAESTRESLEGKLTALFRKKIIIKVSPITRFSLDELQGQPAKDMTYSSYKLNPVASSALIIYPNDLLDMILTLVYGGKLQQVNEGEIKVGKVGLITAENLGGLVFASFTTAMKEYTELTVDHYKTAHTLQTVNNLPNETIYCFDLTICFDEIEKTFKICLPEEFLIKFMPVKTGKGKHKEKDFWRTAIKQEVMDSFVTITTNMADIKLPVNRLLTLKEGDEIEVVDPAVVYVCLNDLKVYRALAGQSNSKIVVKIISQV